MRSLFGVNKVIVFLLVPILTACTQKLSMAYTKTQELFFKNEFFFPYYFNPDTVAINDESLCSRLVFALSNKPPLTDCVVNKRLRRRIESYMRVVDGTRFNPLRATMEDLKVQSLKIPEVNVLMGIKYREKLEELAQVDVKTIYLPIIKKFNTLLSKLKTLKLNREKLDGEMQGKKSKGTDALPQNFAAIKAKSDALIKATNEFNQVVSSNEGVNKRKAKIKSAPALLNFFKVEKPKKEREMKRIETEYNNLYRNEKKIYEDYINKLDDYIGKSVDMIDLIFLIREAYSIAVPLAFESNELRAKNKRPSPFYFSHRVWQEVITQMDSMDLAFKQELGKPDIDTLKMVWTDVQNSMEGIMKSEIEIDQFYATYFAYRMLHEAPATQFKFLFFLLRNNAFYSPKHALLRYLLDLKKENVLGQFIKESKSIFGGNFFEAAESDELEVAKLVPLLSAFVEALVLVADFVHFAHKSQLFINLNIEKFYKEIPKDYYQPRNFFDKNYQETKGELFATLEGFDGKDAMAKDMDEEPVDPYVNFINEKKKKKNIFADLTVLLTTFQHKFHFKPFATAAVKTFKLMVKSGCNQPEELKKYSGFLSSQLDIAEIGSPFFKKQPNWGLDTAKMSFTTYNRYFLTVAFDVRTATYRMTQIDRDYRQFVDSMKRFDDTYEELWNNLEEGSINKRPEFMVLGEIDDLDILLPGDLEERIVV